MTSVGEPTEQSLYRSMAIPVRYSGTMSSSGESSGDEKHFSSFDRNSVEKSGRWHGPFLTVFLDQKNALQKSGIYSRLAESK